jgi:hypothetical protein
MDRVKGQARANCGNTAANSDDLDSFDTGQPFSEHLVGANDQALILRLGKLADEELGLPFTAPVTARKTYVAQHRAEVRSLAH